MVGTLAAHAAERSEYFLLSHVPGGVSQESFLKLASAVFAGRGWKVVGLDEDSVTGHIAHRGIDATLELKLRGDQVQYRCIECTRNAMLVTNDVLPRVRKRSGPYTPEKWIDNLRRDFQAGLLNLPAQATAKTPSVEERLETLESQRSRELVTQEEYDAKRATILSDL